MTANEYIKTHIKEGYWKKAKVFVTSKRVAEIRFYRLKGTDKIPDDHDVFIRIYD